MRKWRKTTWAIVIWTALCALWLFTGMAAVAEDAAVSDAAALGATFGSAFILFFWLLLVIPLSVLWFATRPKENVVVYGPQGQTVTVSEKEARKRVERDGWTYQPRT